MVTQDLAPSHVSEGHHVYSVASTPCMPIPQQMAALWTYHTIPSQGCIRKEAHTGPRCTLAVIRQEMLHAYSMEWYGSWGREVDFARRSR